MAEESVRDLVRYIRTALQEKGPLGAFLLSELDASISRGVEETSSGDRQDKVLPAQIIGRRAPNDAELLGILVSTFETYLLTLPAVSNSLTTYLREHYKVEQVEVTLDPSLLGVERQRTGRAQIDEIAPRTSDANVRAALIELNGLVVEAMDGRD